MKDNQIIELFWNRDKTALEEAQQMYHHLLLHIAKNIAGSMEDAEECVNDTYMKLWSIIPPERPESLKNFAARVVRNLAIDVYRKEKARGKGTDLPLIFDELESMFADGKDAYDEVEFQDLVNGFLSELESKERMLFVRRYWQGESIQDLVTWSGLKESAVKMRLLRTRNKFQEYLKEGGIQV